MVLGSHELPNGCSSDESVELIGLQQGHLGESAVILPQWSVHRDRQYFNDPQQFDPTRWERRLPNSVSAYFPFSTGPHACIGSQFALSRATLALARLTQRFYIDVSSTELRNLRPTPTLRLQEGVSATIKALN